MIVLKGDTVRMTCGMEGEVTEVWGVAKTHLRLRLASGRSVPVFESDVASIVRRPRPGKR